jgi:hypothetical protein
MRTRALYALLILAAGARLLLAVAAMPPYAGLDEAWHVARVAFVAREGRQPNISERSIPPYIGRAIRGEELPAFGETKVVRPIVDRPFVSADLAPYESANYEAQQPPVYYAIAAKLAGGSAVAELRRLRLLSAFFALIVILAAASLGHRYFGPRGVAVAVLIASLPTWITLVIRASNDAMACALAALAIAVSASQRGADVSSARPRDSAADAAHERTRRPLPLMTIIEALLWALAIATKLYVWPIAIAAVVFWRIDSVSRRQSCRREGASPAGLPAPHRYIRIAIVVAACAISALLTMHYLSIHTHNVFGDFGFDAPAHRDNPVPIAWGQMAKITIASLIWTSGQHGDALRPLAMLLYVVPLIAIARTRKSPYFTATAFVLAAFALAQAVNAAAFVRQARAAGLALPLGGKEGWYWYALAPLVICLFAKHARIAAFWLIAWDVVIAEGALFHDYAGVASPAGKNFLFTWGPLHAPFTAHLGAIGVGPLAAHLTALRLAHIALAGALFALESTLHDRNAHIGAAAAAHAA